MLELAKILVQIVIILLVSMNYSIKNLVGYLDDKSYLMDTWVLCKIEFLIDFLHIIANHNFIPSVKLCEIVVKLAIDTKKVSNM